MNEPLGGNEVSMVSFNIESAGIYTKASESNLKTLDVLVFKENGELENRFQFKPDQVPYSTSIAIGQGQKIFRFIANAPEGFVASVSSLQDCDNCNWLFSDNSPEGLVMTGQAAKMIDDAKADLGTIDLVRLVNRVEVQEIHNKLPASVGEISLKRVFLQNVPKNLKTTTYEPSSLWRHDSSNIPENVSSLISLDCSGNIASGNKMTLTGCILYGFPNQAEAAAEISGTDYVTKLVVEIEAGGVSYFYPIGIQDMKSNHQYLIKSLTLNRLGSKDPDHYVTSSAVSLNINVADWLTGTITGSYNGTVNGNDITL